MEKEPEEKEPAEKLEPLQAVKAEPESEEEEEEPEKKVHPHPHWVNWQYEFWKPKSWGDEVVADLHKEMWAKRIFSEHTLAHYFVSFFIDRTLRKSAMTRSEGSLASLSYALTGALRLSCTPFDCFY